MRFEFQIAEEFHKRRLDDFLFEVFPSLSKTYLREQLKFEACEVNGYLANAGRILRANDFVEIEADPDRETAMKPEKMPIDVVYEDDHILVINKPAGLLVHPTHREKNGTLLNGLAFYLNGGGQRDAEAGSKGDQEKGRNPDEVNSAKRKTGKHSPIEVSNGPGNRESEKIRNPKSEIQNPKSVRPGLVHRLDKATSGLILATKTDRALKILSDHFKRKLVRKRYFALVDGRMPNDRGEIREPIGRHPEEKRWNVKADGKSGITNYWVRKRTKDATLVELEPVTGRTNQLRIHCASIGHPIIGDTTYGGRPFSRLCLHATRLEFRHPHDNRLVAFEVELPEAMRLGIKSVDRGA